MEKLSKRFIASVLAVMTVLLTVVAGFSGTAHADNVAVLNSIIVANNPTKTEYYVGDALDTSGILITAVFSDGTSAGVTSGYTCSPTVLNNPGVQTITVSYSGVQTSFKVMVYDYGYTTYPAVTQRPTEATTATTSAQNYTTRPVTPTVAPTQSSTVATTAVATDAPDNTYPPGYTVSPFETTTRRAPATTVVSVPATTRPVVHTTVPATRPNQYGDYSVVVNAKVYELNYGQGTSVNVTVVPSSVNAYIEWSSSDSSVATVNQKGFVTACGEGEVIIRATLVDANGNAILDSQGDEISDTVVIKCTMTIWQKIVQFFRNLFSGFFF